MTEPPKARRSLHARILAALGAGAVAGVVVNQIALRSDRARTIVGYLIDAVAHPIGQLFLRLLFAVVVPLVFCSLALGVTQLGSMRHLGRIGGRTLTFFLITSAFSVALGLAVMAVFRPGEGFDDAVRQQLMTAYGGDAAHLRQTADQQNVGTLLGVVNRLLDSVLPRNILAAAVKMDMLPVIVMALLVGGATSVLPEPHKGRLSGLYEAVAEAMVRIVELAMRLAPYAVFCLVFSVTARFGIDLLRRLAIFVMLVLGSYLVQLFILYPVLVRTMARMSPMEFIRKTIPIVVTAFSTSSSNATLPTTMRVAEQELGVRKTVSGFVLPLGATINMNGTALYEGAVVLFVAQIFGVHLSLASQAAVICLAVAAAIGTAGIPGGSLPLLMAVMAQVGVPPDGIAIILGVDRLLDMGRTVINVMGDVACAVWVERTEAAREARSP
ncbi:MAG: dicarboxylate/amino acid:cation symporter [Deltaproteobacteria bacterium]|nr:dicarboxylate/amino acid:cation symporter [Deltaproteobacteria bacterium]